MSAAWEEVPEEKIIVGDVIKLWCGVKTVTSIRSYEGPLKAIVHSIFEYAPGAAQATGGCSAC